MAKVNRFGKATVLTTEQLQQLWYELDQPQRLITQIAYFTAARIGEVLQLRCEDIGTDTIVYRAANTKTKTTREVEIPSQLRSLLSKSALPDDGYLFPSGARSGHLTRQGVDQSIKQAAALLGIEGVSTHSFRRSMATHLHIAGVPLRAIQRITGHNTLAALEQYLDIERREASRHHQAVLNNLFSMKL